MTPPGAAEAAIAAERGGQREIRGGRGRLGPGDAPRPRCWVPRDSQPGRKSTTASGAGKRREPREQCPRPGPASAQLPEPPRRSHPQPCPVRPGAVAAAAAAAPTCAAAGTVRDGSRSLPAAKRRARRAVLVERLRLPGRGQAEPAAAAAGVPSSRRARGPAGSAARPLLPGTARSRSLPRRGSAAPDRPRAGLALAACAPPLPPSGAGAAGVGNEVPAESPPGRAQLPGVSLRGSLVLGVWTHVRAGGDQELELAQEPGQGGEGWA